MLELFIHFGANKTTLRVLAVCLFLVHVSFAQEKWVKEKSEGNIIAYSRMKQGKDFYEFRTVFQVNTSLNKITNFLSNLSNFKNWMPNCVESTIYKRENDSVFFAYTVTEAPWPASDRDVAFKVVRQKINSNTVLISLVGVANSYPLQKNKVRVQDYHAVWRITRLSENLVEIDYIASFDPGSSYPNWLVKNSLIDARIKVSKKIVEEMKRLNH